MTGWSGFLASRGARFDAPEAGSPDAPRRVAGFGRPELEQTAAREGALACPLLEWTAVNLAGPDAGTFLQGQFTNDVAGLGVGDVQYNGYCSPKGRLLANFPLARLAGDEYLLAVPAGIAEALVRRLRMFVLRAKVVIAPLADTHHCIGIAGSAPGLPVTAGAQQESGLCLLRLPEGRLLGVAATARAQDFWESVTRAATPAGSPLWDWLGIRAGIGVITAPTQDKFVPQMLNWELAGGVSFKKGCYPGQEIVARMQYLGKLKERLYCAHVAVGEGVAPGSALYGEQFGDQACGTVVNAAPAPGGGTDLLAVIQTASAANDRVRIGLAADAPVLGWLPLPYPIPATAK